MVEDFSNSAPLFAIRQYQVRITSEIHANIWILGIDHLLTLDPPEEGISERNLRLTSMTCDQPISACVAR